MSEWVKDWNNDTGPDDDYYIEWFEVKNGERKYKCDEEEDADFLVEQLNRLDRLVQPEPQLCCQKYETCTESCTPRGRYLAKREWAGITWVGLTDEERDEIVENSMNVPLSIEEKLKEKNT